MEVQCETLESEKFLVSSANTDLSSSSGLLISATPLQLCDVCRGFSVALQVQ